MQYVKLIVLGENELLTKTNEKKIDILNFMYKSNVFVDSISSHHLIYLFDYEKIWVNLLWVCESVCRDELKYIKEIDVTLGFYMI